MENLHAYWSLPREEQDHIREEAGCLTEEAYQAFLDALFPPAESLNEAMQAAGADGDE